MFPLRVRLCFDWRQMRCLRAYHLTGEGDCWTAWWNAVHLGPLQLWWLGEERAR